MTFQVILVLLEASLNRFAIFFLAIIEWLNLFLYCVFKGDGFLIIPFYILSILGILVKGKHSLNAEVTEAIND